MEAVQQKPRRARTSTKMKAFQVILIIVVIVSVFFAVVFYNRYNQIKKNPQAITTAQTTALVKQVGKLINLPANETPTIATVQNTSKLSGQPFFDGAKVGDKLLIYTTAKKAILYRPSTNRIINVGPIAINTTNTPTSGTTTSP
jgi:hypothetical protein